ncbi:MULTISPECIES: cupin domain-containing protein [unclassified Arenibacter]|jgi:quercetin dioxygenase-like cupin family protein|uniref:cupin domain-containing protein n=1 Tax=unclassified Arenibacter TaxID=2615047 RepID=UPI000E34212A|nr:MULTISPECIES: cupin domain-containing protein [unclassified Arenibacter]MCM4164266.1 cupin [Arenibacter sp. A80]RFT56054.1 cupin domain-containing protein [Arenibacter sp. P308M17]
MEVLNRPQLTHLQVGENLKILQIEALANKGMPEHNSSHEAVIVVQEGEAILKTKDVTYVLKKGTTMVVPAGLKHSLSAIKDFKAVAIMATDSIINFKN